MSQYRFDPIRRIGVLYAPERDDRPIRIGPAAGSPGPATSTERVDRSGNDPFAPGFEGETPPEVLAIRPPDSLPDDSAWLLRVVPNRYPFVMRWNRADQVGRGSHPQNGEVAGFHEVVIETRESAGDLADLDEATVAEVVRAWRARLVVYAQTPGIEWACLFRNSGPLSGASLPHPHSQLVGLPYVPPRVASVRSAMAEQLRATGRCVVCEEISEAQAWRVDESERFVAFCPRVSRFPYEQRIVVRSHEAGFLTTAEDDAAVTELARLLRRRLQALKRVLPRLDYNLVLDAGPLRQREQPQAERSQGAAACGAPAVSPEQLLPGVSTPADHWCLEILPRTGGIAGFELVSGEWVNAVLPETAAARLRSGR